jgi:hypothetical protein
MGAEQVERSSLPVAQAHRRVLVQAGLSRDAERFGRRHGAVQSGSARGNKRAGRKVLAEIAAS